MTVGEIAGIFGVSADTVRRHHAAWTRDRGFPEPLPFVDGVRGLRWSRAAVAAWQLHGAAGAAVDNTIDNIDWAAIAAARSALVIAGLDPDEVAINSANVPTLAASD